MVRKLLALTVLSLALSAAPARATTPGASGDASFGFFKSRFPVNAVLGCRVTVTTTATELTCGLSGARVRIVKNCGTAGVDVGSAALVAGAAYLLDAGDPPITYTPAFDGQTGTTLQVYGRVASGTQSMCVFEAK